jgi:hypothetical protein
VTDPTPLDLANAATRQSISERQNAAYREAELLALRTLGPGFTPWMALRLIPSDHRQSGNSTPAATVFKVYRGDEKLTENAMFIRQMTNGQLAKSTSYEPLFGDLLHEKHQSRTMEIRGEQVPVDRYELCWSAMELYHPRSAEALATAREKRQERAVANEAEASPLFSEQILAEGVQPRKPRGQTPG